MLIVLEYIVRVFWDFLTVDVPPLVQAVHSGRQCDAVPAPLQLRERCAAEDIQRPRHLHPVRLHRIGVSWILKFCLPHPPRHKRVYSAGNVRKES